MLTSVTSPIAPSRPRPASSRPAPKEEAAAAPTESVELSGARSAAAPNTANMAVPALAGAALGDPAVATTFKVLSLNIWEDGHQGVDQIIELARVDPDPRVQPR